MSETKLEDMTLLKVRDAACLLGLTQVAVYKAVERGEIPVVRLGKRRLRFKASALRAFIDEREMKPIKTPDATGGR